MSDENIFAVENSQQDLSLPAEDEMNTLSRDIEEIVPEIGELPQGDGNNELSEPVDLFPPFSDLEEINDSDIPASSEDIEVTEAASQDQEESQPIDEDNIVVGEDNDSSCEESESTEKTESPLESDSTDDTTSDPSSLEEDEDPDATEIASESAETEEDRIPEESEITPDEVTDSPETGNPSEGDAVAETTDSDEVAQEEAPAEEAKAVSPAQGSDVPYHERYYLRYNEGKRSTPLDLSGTKAFLQALGFDGGELRKTREEKDRAESLRNSDKPGGNQMRCSYCGAEISGVDFYRLPDGRLRCTTCSSTVVKTKAEIEELCQRVVSNLDNFFGATIDVPVSIEVVDERKLKKKVGVPLGTPDSQSILILGVAINKKNTYSIILENGAPRISLIATFAHELTHIWQYTHWDNLKGFPKCPKEKRLLIYEGMAKWVEIQYLYLIGETNVAKREEYITRQRQDEYGIGFCLYEDQYPLAREVMSCEVTPFTTDKYPIGE